MSKKSEAFIKRHSASFQFALTPEQYSTQALKSATPDDLEFLRSEYSRMRDVAQKRLKRLAKSDFSQAKALQERPAGFPKLKDIRSQDFPYAMNELYRFVAAKGSTVQGQKEIRAKTIATFAEHKVHITEEEYPEFIKILEKMRKQKLNYESGVAKSAADFIVGLNKGSVTTNRIFTSRKRLRALMENYRDLSKLEQKIAEVNESGRKFTAIDATAALKEFGWLE